MSFSYHMEQKKSPKQVAQITYTLGKTFLWLLLRFVGHFLSDRVKKTVVYFGLYDSSLYY